MVEQRPLKTLELPQIFAHLRAAAAKRPSDAEMMLHAWAEASARHAALGKFMQMRPYFDTLSFPKPERFSGRTLEPVDWFLEAYNAARSLEKGRAKRGIYRVYVLLLRGRPGSPDATPALYVGESHLTAEERLAQHLGGVNHARVVERFGVAALLSFTPQLTKLSRKDSKRLEAELAERLRGTLAIRRLPPSYVQGGH